MFWNKLKAKSGYLFGILFALIISFATCAPSLAEIALPTLNVGMQPANSPREFSQGVQILILLTDIQTNNILISQVHIHGFNLSQAKQKKIILSY